MAQQCRRVDPHHGAVSTRARPTLAQSRIRTGRGTPAGCLRAASLSIALSLGACQPCAIPFTGHGYGEICHASVRLVAGSRRSVRPSSAASNAHSNDSPRGPRVALARPALANSRVGSLTPSSRRGIGLIGTPSGSARAIVSGAAGRPRSGAIGAPSSIGVLAEPWTAAQGHPQSDGTPP
jgi:hypothetical protein